MISKHISQPLAGILLVLLLASSSGLAQERLGIEFEYQGIGAASDFTNPQNQRNLLAHVIPHFGLQGEIQTGPWGRFDKDLNFFFSQMKDRGARSWSVVPEYIVRGYDGYELVTPPLNWLQDREALKAVLKEIRESGQFVDGRSSSSHVTFDVSHLTQNPQDYAQLVDLILFLESHMIEIFNAIGPKRYGTTINVYTIPLALNQSNLLAELAELPREQRTWQNIIEIFQRYEPHEKELMGSSIAWKFRAINYGKLFGLGAYGEHPQDVIEVRVPDLLNDQKIEGVVDFLVAVMRYGATVQTKRFINPFRSIAHFEILDMGGVKHTRVDDLIHSFPNASYKAFVRSLGLDPLRYPKKYHPSGRGFLNCSKVLGAR